MIKGVLLDLSGVLYTGNEALPGAKDAVERLVNAGLPVRYVTNTSRSSRQAILSKLDNMGFDINEDDLFTAPMATYQYLQKHGLSPYLLVHPELRQDFENIINDKPDAVVVGDAADAFTYKNMNEAFRLLLDGAPLIAMGKNQYFKSNDGFSLDMGPFVVALEFATDTEALIIGKPARTFFDVAVSTLKSEAGDIVMVGDDVSSDVVGAMDAGLQGVLVKTGKYRDGDEEQIENRGLCLRDISEVADYIIENS